MEILPDPRNLKEHKLFARAFYGEAIGLVIGIGAIVRMSMMETGFLVPMAALFLFHGFLVWAWGRRYPFIDAVYALWNLPTLLLMIASLCGIAWSVARYSGGISIRGIQFGDGSINLLGLVALIVATASRSMGTIWCFRRKAVEFKEHSYIPALGLASVLIVGSGYAIFARKVELLFMAGLMGFYGLGISI